MAQPVLVVRVAASVEEFKKNLQEGINQIEVVKTSLTRMATSYDPQVLITKANTTAAAIQQIGGVSLLSAEQAARANRDIVAGLEAAERAGKAVPPGLREMAAATRDAAQPASTLSGIYKQFDGVLQALGINIGPQVKGIEDLADASRRGGEGIGFMGAAGLALGAGVAGWGIGRAIANFFDLDTKIANATARLMGYGDVAAEVAGAKQDVINRAIANGAKETITYQEAIEFNTKAIRTAANSYVDWAAVLEKSREFVRGLSQAQIDNIQIARQMGATQEQLQHDFGLTAEHVKALDEMLKQQGANEQKLAETQKQLAAVKLQHLEEERRAVEQNAKRFANLAQENLAIELSITATKQQARAASIEAEFQREVAKLNRLDERYAEYYALLERQRDLNLQKESANYDQINAISRTALQERAEQELETLRVMQERSGEFSAAQIAQQRETWYAALEAVRNFGLEGAAALKQFDDKATETAQKAKEVAKAVSEVYSMDVKPLTGYALDNVVNRFHQAGDGSQADALKRALAYLEGMEGRYNPKNNEQFFAMQADQLLLEQLRKLKGTGKIPGFASGVTNFEGGLAYVHRDEMLVNMPRGTSVIPAGRSAGVVNLAVNLYASATRQDGEMIARAILDSLRPQGFLPAGAGA